MIFRDFFEIITKPLLSKQSIELDDPFGEDPADIDDVMLISDGRTSMPNPGSGAPITAFATLARRKRLCSKPNLVTLKCP